MAIKYYPEHLPPTTEHLIWGGDAQSYGTIEVEGT